MVKFSLELMDIAMPKLSVIIITKNEANNIRRCLESVKFANEIIILDSGSTDNTINICREYTDKVYETDWPGYGPQKNRALKKATGEWVLSIDADEWVSDGLKQEIITAINTKDALAYFMPRRWIVCGKHIKHGDWGHDNVLRLFVRKQGHFTDVIVHEGVRVKGKTKKFKQPLFHNSILEITKGLEKMNLYSSLSAQKKKQNGGKTSLFKAITHGGWMFLRSYILRLGFLDGKIGFLTAFINAEHSFYSYAKQWDLHKANSSH